MARVNCLECEHRDTGFNRSCSHNFRFASGAAGQAVDDIHDVYFCRDFSSREEDMYNSDGTRRIGDSATLKVPERGYKYVEIVRFYGRDILVRTTSGWEFSVREDDLEEA